MPGLFSDPRYVFWVTGVESNDLFGRAVGAEDFDGDGIADLVAGFAGSTRARGRSCGPARATRSPHPRGLR